MISFKTTTMTTTMNQLCNKICSFRYYHCYLFVLIVTALSSIVCRASSSSSSSSSPSSCCSYTMLPLEEEKETATQCLKDNKDDGCCRYCNSDNSNNTTTTIIEEDNNNHETITSPTPSLCYIFDNKKQQQDNNEYSYYDVVLVTDDLNIENSAEDDTIMESLEKLHKNVTRVSLQDSDFDWTTAKLILMRSAYGKYDYYDEYMNFLQSVEQHSYLLNPRHIIEWSASKSIYFEDLQKAGINIPQTIYIEYEYDNILPELEDLAEELDCTSMVMKPDMGNTGIGVQLFDIEEDTDVDLNNIYDTMELILENDENILVQCFQEQIQTRGERGVVFIGGKLTHGILKIPGEGSILVHEEYGGSTHEIKLTRNEKNFAKQVLTAVVETVGEIPAYLRVDIFYDNDDKLSLMEIAAGTVSLFTYKYPKAADVLANYIDNFLKEKEQECISLRDQEPAQDCTGISISS